MTTYDDTSYTGSGKYAETGTLLVKLPEKDTTDELVERVIAKLIERELVGTTINNYYNYPALPNGAPRNAHQLNPYPQAYWN